MSSHNKTEIRNLSEAADFCLWFKESPLNMLHVRAKICNFAEEIIL